MKNFFILCISSLLLSSCLSEVDLLTDRPNRLAKPVLYSLIGNDNDVRIYYTNSLFRNDTINFHFRKKENILLRSNSTVFPADQLKFDVIQRPYNSTERTNFKNDDLITTEVDNHIGSCTMPKQLIYKPKITAVNNNEFAFEFKVQLNVENLEDFVDQQYLGVEFNSFHKNKRIFSAFKKDQDFLEEGVDYTPFGNLLKTESSADLTLEFTISLQKNNIYVDARPSATVTFEKISDFTNDLEFRLSLISLDKNIQRYILEEQNNARGIENPLGTYSQPWGNITNAYGFCGCFNKNLQIINY